MKQACYILLFSFLWLATSCGSESNGLSDDDTTPNTSTNEEDLYDDFTVSSKDTTFTNAVSVLFEGDQVEIENPYSGNGVSVSTSGAGVVIHSTTSTEITYVLKGASTVGSFKIYSDARFTVALNGLNLICSDGPVINNQSKEQATILLVGNSTNRLIDNNVYASNEEDQKGTIFSEGGLIFSGSGSLTLKGYYKHAICSDDFVEINGGSILVLSAYKDGIHAKDYCLVKQGTIAITSTDDAIDSEDGSVQIEGGELTLTTEGEGAKGIKSVGDMIISGGYVDIKTAGSAYFDVEDKDITSASGIKCDGSLEIKGGTLKISCSGAGGKGINVDGSFTLSGGTVDVTTSGELYRYGNDDTAAKAIKADGDIVVNGGDVVVKTSKSEAEGIESKSTITVNNGTIEVIAYDDCINASNNITINGGKIYCYSTSNDGIDSNGTLVITGGIVISSSTTSPEEGFDCDNNAFKITGGTIIGTGGASSTPTASVSTQYSVIYGGTGSTGQLIHVETEGGTEILTYKISRSYSSQMTLLFSTPSLSANTSYTIYTGGSVSGGTDFNGLYTSSTYTKGTSTKTFTVSSKVTTVGNVSSGGGGGRP